jgi:hypothetical protein
MLITVYLTVLLFLFKFVSYGSWFIKWLLLSLEQEEETKEDEERRTDSFECKYRSLQLEN